MGTKMAPSFVNIFMSDLEERFPLTQPKTPLIWKRYIDYIIIYDMDTQQRWTPNLRAADTSAAQTRTQALASQVTQVFFTSKTKDLTKD